MSNAPVDPFIANPVNTSVLDQKFRQALDGLDAGLNNVIMSLGSKLDGLTSEVRGMGKGSIADLGGKSLAGGLDSAPPLVAGNTPSIQEKGEAPKIEKSVMPEKVIAQAQSIGSSSGMKVEHVAAADIGNFCPACTPTTGVGMGMGRGGMSI
jgi:hypothetical protein